MKKYTFLAVYGDEAKRVDITQVSGGNGSHHLMIDGYYRGSFHEESGEWMLNVQIPNWTPEKEMEMERLRPSLQTADISILEEIFNKEFLT